MITLYAQKPRTKNLRRYREDIWGNYLAKSIQKSGYTPLKQTFYNRYDRQKALMPQAFNILKVMRRSVSHVAKELAAIYYERARRWHDERRYGVSFRIDIHKPRKMIKKRNFRKAFFFERTKLRKFYGLFSESQIRKYFSTTQKDRADKSLTFLTMFETRLESILLRVNIANSRVMARNLIRAKEVLVNLAIRESPIFRIITGDLITFLRPLTIRHFIEAGIFYKKEMLIAKKFRYGYNRLVKYVHSRKWHPFRARFLTFERWLMYRARSAFIFKIKKGSKSKLTNLGSKLE